MVVSSDYSTKDPCLLIFMQKLKLTYPWEATRNEHVCLHKRPLLCCRYWLSRVGPEGQEEEAGVGGEVVARGGEVVDWMLGLSVVDWMLGLSVVDWMLGLSVVDWTLGLSVVDWTLGLSVVDWMLGLSVVDWTLGLSVVDWTLGEAVNWMLSSSGQPYNWRLKLISSGSPLQQR